ncbi:hypothetical protein AAFF_G00320790 [Aldrovandia affinis]|uniref:Uncharacterized protein n=1 Tax=Aldrovandia affinis TaxID=143900 RepID=A0AAD7R6T3_9TELE|nr:hypothetical protein AAFF_G00320790 [Aldrovandia affinis]
MRSWPRPHTLEHHVTLRFLPLGRHCTEINRAHPRTKTYEPCDCMHLLKGLREFTAAHQIPERRGRGTRPGSRLLNRTMPSARRESGPPSHLTFSACPGGRPLRTANSRAGINREPSVRAPKRGCRSDRLSHLASAR